MKRNFKWFPVLLALLFFAVCISQPTGSVETPATDSVETVTETNVCVMSSELSVHFIDVGQGDATLIICGDDSMLIDAGNDAQGTKVQSYLQKQGVEKLKYVLATHPDTDHVGGMDVILYKFDCETILMTDIASDNRAYSDVLDTLQNKGYRITLPVVGEEYALGDAAFTIVGPVSSSEESNNNSIAILLTHGENKFLFTGDAEGTEEKEILESGVSLDADVYKAGHHGSATSSTEEFLKAVSPAYAVISCAVGNSYGHPHSATLDRFQSMDIEVFRTDEQGTIVATSDGQEIRWSCSPSETWKPGEVSESSTSAAAAEPTVETAPASSSEAAEVTYVCNKNTKKFHKPTCSSVNDMSDKNKLPVTVSRDELIEQGYQPCKRCNP
jgi:competence protein ComEC